MRDCHVFISFLNLHSFYTIQYDAHGSVQCKMSIMHFQILQLQEFLISFRIMGYLLPSLINLNMCHSLQCYHCLFVEYYTGSVLSYFLISSLAEKIELHFFIEAASPKKVDLTASTYNSNYKVCLGSRC